MEENGTRGIRGTDGFQPINQDQGSDKTFSYDNGSNGQPDRWGLTHLPKLFQYLEEHFSFFALLISIIGYVIIAAFGGVQTFGQYLGYIIFLCGVSFIYNFKNFNFKKDDCKWFYLFLLVIFILFGYVVVQNWLQISYGYGFLNKIFEIKIDGQATSTLTHILK